MELEDEYLVAASREVVYAALNDPEVLQQCIPGCKEISRRSDTELDATMVLKFGPVKATFKSAVTLTNLQPPESYTLIGEGKGGAAGFAKGSADVRLVEDGANTVLEYKVKANVGGKLAQVGGRLVESTTRKIAADFFGKLAEVIEAADTNNDRRNE